MSFTIKQGRFEGPYHKLLELIESHKLSINEISLISIADEYIAYIKSLQSHTSLNIDNKDDISQFIVVAATLMLIKAKSLLPTMEYSKEEQLEISNLEYKLTLYKSLIDASKALKQSWSNSKINFSKKRMYIDEIVFTPSNLKSITLQSVSILTIVKLPLLQRLKQVAVAQTLKIENIINDILSYMRSFSLVNDDLNKIHKFKNIFTNLYLYNDKQTAIDKRLYIIVSFLAILDMLKNNQIEASQTNNTEDIEIIYLGKLT